MLSFGSAEVRRKANVPAAFLPRLSWVTSQLLTTDLIIEGRSLQTVLAGPVLGGGELGVEGGEVEERRGPLKGQTAERDGDGRRGKGVGIGKVEADLQEDQTGSRTAGGTDI